MNRVIPVTVIVGLCLTLWLAAGGPAPPPADAQRLHGVWVSPPLLLDEDLEGRVELAFAFTGDQPTGQARLNVIPTDELAPPVTVGPLRAVVKEGPGRSGSKARTRTVAGRTPTSPCPTSW